VLADAAWLSAGPALAAVAYTRASRLSAACRYPLEPHVGRPRTSRTIRFSDTSISKYEGSSALLNRTPLPLSSLANSPALI
jgi:hypothetical protein